MRSSYMEYNYGPYFTTIINTCIPKNPIEFGILDGYSTLHICEGLKINYFNHGIKSKLQCFDLWDKYEYNHGNKDEVDMLLRSSSLGDFAVLKDGDFYKNYNNFQDNSIDFIHIDISNTGETLLFFLEYWHNKIQNKGIVIFEGGSQERDKIEWMIKYNKKPIFPILENNNFLKSHYYVGTYNPFPSMTVMMKFN